MMNKRHKKKWMLKAKFVTEVTVIDPGTNLPVEVSIFKEQSGGMFGIDSSYISQVLEQDDSIPSPFGNGKVILID